MANPIEQHSHNLYAALTHLMRDDQEDQGEGDSICTGATNGAGQTIPFIRRHFCGKWPSRIITHASQRAQQGAVGNDQTSGSSMNLLSTVSGAGGVAFKTAGGGYANLVNEFASELPYDGTVDFTTVFGADGAAFRYITSPLESQSGAEYFEGVMPDLTDPYDNRVNVSYFVFDDDSDLDRDYDFYDGRVGGTGVLRLTANPSSDILGYANLAEDPSVIRGSSIAGMIGRLPPVLVTEHLTNARTRTYMFDSERRTTGSNAAVSGGGNLVLAGAEFRGLDAMDNPLAGPSYTQLASGGKSLADLAVNAAADDANPRSHTDAQLTHRTAAQMADPTERAFIWIVLKPETGLSTTEVRDGMVDLMNRREAAMLAAGRPLPHFLLLVHHKDAGITAQQHDTWYAGLELAAQTRSNASSLDMAGLHGHRDFTDTDAAIQAYIAQEIATPTAVAIGGESPVDVSGGGWTGDGTHPTDDGVRGYAQLIVQAIASAVAPAGGFFRRPLSPLSRLGLLDPSLLGGRFA